MTQASGTTLRVFLVDDHELIRRGFAAILATEPDLEVVGEASTRHEALELIAVTLPDVAVVDLRLPDGYGVAVCREIRERHEGVRCLMLTAFEDEAALMDAVRAGASGYVLKDIDGTELVDAVRTIGRGGSLFDPAMVARANRDH